MKKEEIYVVIDSEEKRLRAIQILNDAKEEIFKTSSIFTEKETGFLRFSISDDYWYLTVGGGKLTKITLDQLEQMLNPNFVVKEVVLSIDELKAQAEILGFDLVKKERQIKVGDFGKFYDSDENYCLYSFLENISKSNMYQPKAYTTGWSNFSHLTDEEKQQIQENW